MAAKNIFKIEVEDMDRSDDAYSSGKKASKKKSEKKSKITKLSAVNLNPNPATKAKDIFAEKVASDDANSIKPKNILEEIKDAKDNIKKTVVDKISDDEMEEKTEPIKEKQDKTLKKKIKLKASDVEARLNSNSSLIKDIIQEEAEKQESELKLSGEKIHTKRSIRTYRKIAYFFLGLTSVIIMGVLYFTMISVKIVLVANQERTSNNLIFDIYDSTQSEQTNGIPGIVEELSIDKTMQFAATGEEIIGKEAVGKVTIVNNYTKNQPLVATTRLVPVSDAEKLFRIKNTVNVPAGGSVEVDIYADEPSPDMAIAATKFTIPGLWAGLQDKIYATSKEAIVYQQKVEKYLTEEDIDNARRDLKQMLLGEAKEMAKNDFSEYETPIFKIDENTVSSNYEGEIGDKMDNFNMTMNAKVVLVAFKEASAIKLAEQKFSSSLPQNKEIVQFDKESLIYALNNFDLDNDSATVNVTFEGKVSLTDDSSVVDVDSILGLSEDQLRNYLSGIPDIADYKIDFSPAFIPDFLKRVPPLKDKVIIEVSN